MTKTYYDANESIIDWAAMDTLGVSCGKSLSGLELQLALLRKCAKKAVEETVNKDHRLQDRYKHWERSMRLMVLLNRVFESHRHLDQEWAKKNIEDVAKRYEEIMSEELVDDSPS